MNCGNIVDESLKIQRLVLLKEDPKKIITLVVSTFVLATLLMAINIYLVFFNFLMIFLLVWFPRLKLVLIYSATSLSDASHVGIYGICNQFSVSKLVEDLLPDISDSHLNHHCSVGVVRGKVRWFEYKKYKYFYIPERKAFTVVNFEIQTSIDTVHRRFVQGLTANEVLFQKKIFGNSDLIIEIDSLLNLLIKEITDPFYVFQVIVCLKIDFFCHFVVK